MDSRMFTIFPFLALLSFKIAWEEERKDHDKEQHEGKHFFHARIALLVGILLLALFLWVFEYQTFATRHTTRMTPSDSTVARIPNAVGTVMYRFAIACFLQLWRLSFLIRLLPSCSPCVTPRTKKCRPSTSRPCRWI